MGEDSEYTSSVESTRDVEIYSTSTTRRIVRTQTLPHNAKDPTATVQAKLMAQKRSKSDTDWADADGFDLRSLRPGEQVVLDLGPNQTKALFLALVRNYAEAGQLDELLSSVSLATVNPAEVAIIDGKAREILERLIEQEGEEVWEHLSDMHPDMLKTINLRQQHEDRRGALSVFKGHLDANDWPEGEWQKFFANNPWIFGFGLASQFVTIIDGQPHYGGCSSMAQVCNAVIT